MSGLASLSLSHANLYSLHAQRPSVRPPPLDEEPPDEDDDEAQPDERGDGGDAAAHHRRRHGVVLLDQRGRRRGRAAEVGAARRVGGAAASVVLPVLGDEDDAAARDGGRVAQARLRVAVRWPTADEERDSPGLRRRREAGGAGRCLVHCAGGMNRSGVLAVAYAMESRRWPLLDAVAHCAGARGPILWNAGFQQELVDFARENDLLVERQQQRRHEEQEEKEEMITR